MTFNSVTKLHKLKSIYICIYIYGYIHMFVYDIYALYVDVELSIAVAALITKVGFIVTIRQ